MSTLTFLSGMLRENKLSLKPFSASSPIYVSALKKSYVTRNTASEVVQHPTSHSIPQ